MDSKHLINGGMKVMMKDDNWKRLMKVMNLTLEISKKTPNDLLSMYKDMEDVLQHNVDLISNYDIKKKLFDRIF